MVKYGAKLCPFNTQRHKLLNMGQNFLNMGQKCVFSAFSTMRTTGFF